MLATSELVAGLRIAAPFGNPAREGHSLSTRQHNQSIASRILCGCSVLAYVTCTIDKMGDPGDVGADDDVHEKHKHVPVKIVDDGDSKLVIRLPVRGHAIRIKLKCPHVDSACHVVDDIHGFRGGPAHHM